MNQPLLPAPSQLRREIGLPQRSSRSTELAISLVARVGEKVATTTSLVLQIAFVCFCLWLGFIAYQGGLSQVLTTIKLYIWSESPVMATSGTAWAEEMIKKIENENLSGTDRFIALSKQLELLEKYEKKDQSRLLAALWNYAFLDYPALSLKLVRDKNELADNFRDFAKARSYFALSEYSKAKISFDNQFRAITSNNESKEVYKRIQQFMDIQYRLFERESLAVIVDLLHKIPVFSVNDSFYSEFAVIFNRAGLLNDNVKNLKDYTKALVNYINEENRKQQEHANKNWLTRTWDGKPAAGKLPIMTESDAFTEFNRQYDWHYDLLKKLELVR
ncbi:MAG TPA: hypothetical protein DCG57_19380 [Candidatus Riflebacteria bacterium]|jgi:hypothetical protein|nr:hypothetical protein [Candidatus Riflebacteria bacterium]